MKLYKLDYEIKGFIGIRSLDPNDSGYDASRMIRYEPKSVRDRWKHPPVEFEKWDWLGKRVNRKKHPEWYESDAPGDNYFSALAANALRDLWEMYGELLPLESKDGEFYVYHCMNILDAIDRLACEFNWSTIVKYVFKPDVVRGQHIFLQAAPNEGPIFVSDIFVDRVKSAGLKGFKFTPVWSEETGPIVEERPAPAVEQPRHGKTCKPMSQSTRRDVVDKLVAMAKKDLKIDVAVDPPEKVLERIGQEVQSAQGWATRFDEVVGVGMVLGSLWGELVCRESGWWWAMVDDVAAVVSPTRSHVVFPHAWFHDLIRSGGRRPRLSELYGMIKAGSLPQSEPDSCLVLA
ncbi:MAG: imm11 family protein [Tepidisphaeraceae bacterium]